MITIILLGLLTCIMSPLCQAHAVALSEGEAIALVLRNNPNVKNTLLTRITDKLALKSPFHDFTPQYNFDASGTYTRTSGQPITTRNITLSPKVTLKNRLGTNFTLSANGPIDIIDEDGGFKPTAIVEFDQPLLRGFGLAINDISLDNAVDTDKSAKLTMKNDIMSQIKTVLTDYRTLINDRYSIETSKNSLKRNQELLLQTKAKIRAGQEAPSDLVRTEADVTTQQFALEQAQHQLRIDTLDFLETVWLPPETKLNIPRDIKIKFIKIPSLQQSIKIALAHNISYIKALIDIRKDYRAVLTAEDNQRWKLNVTGKTELNSPDTIRGLHGLIYGKKTNTIGFSLNVPIDDFNLAKATADAKIALEKAKNNLAITKRDTVKTITTDRKNIIFQQKQVSISSKQLKQKEQVYNIDREKQKYGLVSIFQVQSDLNDVISARGDLISAKISYLNNVTTFYNDMGILLEKRHVTLTY